MSTRPPPLPPPLENGDSWATLSAWTAERGPRGTLRLRAPMSETSGPERKNGRQRRNPPGVPEGASAGWSILSYMLGGMALYGALGWLIGRWTGIGVLFPVGMLVGLGLAITLIILRYGRH